MRLSGTTAEHPTLERCQVEPRWGRAGLGAVIGPSPAGPGTDARVRKPVLGRGTTHSTRKRVPLQFLSPRPLVTTPKKSGKKFSRKNFSGGNV